MILKINRSKLIFVLISTPIYTLDNIKWGIGNGASWILGLTTSIGNYSVIAALVGFSREDCSTTTLFTSSILGKSVWESVWKNSTAFYHM